MNQQLWIKMRLTFPASIVDSASAVAKKGVIGVTKDKGS